MTPVLRLGAGAVAGIVGKPYLASIPQHAMTLASLLEGPCPCMFSFQSK